jgi:hypothetical protein
MTAQSRTPAFPRAERISQENSNLRSEAWSSDYYVQLTVCAADADQERALADKYVEACNGYEEERRKFQDETLRTSELSQLLALWLEIYEPGHNHGPDFKSCIRCKLVHKSKELIAKPVNCNAYDTLRAQNAALKLALQKVESALLTAGGYSGGAQVARNIASAALLAESQGEGK